MKKFTEKPCRICGIIILPTAPAMLYCESCKATRDREITDRERVQAREAYRNKQFAKGRILGHGKGSSNKKGIDSPYYKNGIGNFHKNLKPFLRSLYSSCQWCNKDLTTASQYEWCVHHIDHDRNNNTIDNLILLCKSCHQKEHSCHLAFLKGATTIPSGSTLKRVEAQDTSNGSDIV